MSQAELEIGRTVIRTVRFEFVPEEIEKIVTEHVKRAYGFKLRDFSLAATLDVTSGCCTVDGEARTEGLAPTRKRKARA